SGGVVGAGVEELDRALELRRQVRGEIAPPLDHARLEALVDEAQAVPGGDQLEGQRDERAALRFVELLEAHLLCTLQDRLELRQVLLPDEAVLREEFVARR